MWLLDGALIAPDSKILEACGTVRFISTTFDCGEGELMALQTKKSGRLYLRGDMSQASSPLRYSVDSPDDFDYTPFQTATAGHSWKRAFAVVRRWLKGQGNMASKYRRNPPSGWIPARAVKITKGKGRVQVRIKRR